MKCNTPLKALIFLLPAILLFSSCQADSDGPDETNMPEEGYTISEEAITKNDPLVNNILKITTINGSRDDVLDSLSQAKVIFPVKVSMNGQTFTVENRKGLKIAEIVAEYSIEDDDKVFFDYPIDMRFNDFSVKTIENEEQLVTVKEEYKNKPDYNAVSGATVIYPVSFAFFNTISRERGMILVRNNRDMMNLLTNMLQSDVLEIEYPISIRSEFEDKTISIIDNDQLTSEIKLISDQYQVRLIAEPVGTVNVCHVGANGRTERIVEISTLAAHLRHGDIIGGCL
ncbi:hypothetical protein [Spongiivirga citrea]|uniref:Uncharacterized protein n=1 Tax=Spongiivirga citrea TaxID=1481457 RepID=A0A6M0CQE2_9FLAO|nr:hypothetical protein [Spongiivirga citrea]NER16150.1 hypothetical protein [Spongiivirga citrea]